MVKSKTSRDPGAPKRNMSTYLLYQNAMRDQFKAINPGMTFGQLAKYTSAMYAEMPPAEKESWAARAEADKERYLHELSSYVPAAGYDAKGDSLITDTAHGAAKPPGRRYGKVEKDINAAKRNISAYLLYQNAMRNTFKQENPPKRKQPGSYVREKTRSGTTSRSRSTFHLLATMHVEMS